jgi:L-alanine-DL-glutamate epimerase-like enolase superfamily enzyme
VTDDCTIVRAAVRLARVPVDPPRGDAIQQFDALELPIVTLIDRAGRRGTGFGYTIGTGGTAIAKLLRDTLLPKTVGADGRRIAGLMEQLRRAIHALTPGCVSSTALAAIDVALWDLAGRRTNTPLYMLLGGARDRVRLYNTDVGWLNRPLDEMVHLAKRAVTRDGFTALKLKVGKENAAEDVERLAKVREAVGPDVMLMADANQSWTIDDAISHVKKLEPYDLYWIEEPLEATDFNGYARLGQHTSIARAGGESLYTPASFYEAIRRDALDILQPDVARIGGITRAIEVCHLAAAANLHVAPHVSPELSVTVACAVPNSIFVEYVPQMEPILKRPITIRNGYAIPPETPGHGIEFNPDALVDFTVWDTESSSSPEPQPA